jgi:hypothetical protein
MDVTLWTQSSDYDSEDHGSVTLDKAAETIRTFPWTSELERQQQLKDDTCPPGVGLVRGKEVLHVFATGSERWSVNLSFKRQGKLLGFLPKPNGNVTGSISSLDEVMPLLRLFFSGDCDRLVTAIDNLPR